MDVGTEGIRAQIGRLLQSRTFEGSEIHRKLLEYLTEKAIAGEADRLKEYTIALDAFGKPPSYDPKRDSIVRLQVGRLRQKLNTYYQTEASGDPILVSLPKGAFKLKFESLAEAPESPEAPDLPPRRRRPWLLPLLLALTAVWAIAATVILVRQHGEVVSVDEQWNPELQSLWAPFLESSRPMLVCLGTPLFVRVPEFGFFRDPKTNDWQEIGASERVSALRRAMPDRDMFPSYAFTGAGEASAAFLIAKLLSPRKPGLRLTRSSILSWQQIADNDIVFIGPPKFNLQLQAAALRQDIVVEPEGIRNLKPAPGEPVFLPDRIVPGKQSEGETHALISLTPGPSGAGELLVIAGNASSDTFASAEWITQPWTARELAAYLRTPSGRFPRYFQAVLRVSFKQGIPVQTAYVFHHVLGQSGQAKAAR